jgi:hypothetical protein
MSAPREISELVSRFTENLESYASDAYNEAQLPIRPIDFADTADRERHERMVSLVEEMISLHRQLAVADRQIDRLVYNLYNLTEEEIRLVEND